MTASDTECGPPPRGLTNPLFDYSIAECASITGGAFVPEGVWPTLSSGAYLFADFVCGKIFELVPTSEGGFTTREFASSLVGPRIVTMRFDPNPARQTLYYTTYSDGGQLRRITAQPESPALPDQPGD